MKMDGLPARLLFVACVIPLLGATPPKHTGKVAETPDILQTNPKAKFPGNGATYCAPAALSNAFMWLSAHGYEKLRLTEGGTDEEAQFDMVRLLASPEMMNTHLDDGTNAKRLLRGAQRYAEEAGYKCRRAEYRGWSATAKEFRLQSLAPDPLWLKISIADEDAAVCLDVGFYTYDKETGKYERVGGHWLTLAGYGQDENGREDPDVFILKDPSSRSGTAPANEYVRFRKLESGTLVGTEKGLPRSAVGYYEVTGGMHIPKKAKHAILDGVAVVVLEK